MPFPPIKPKLCRQPRCIQGAGQSGLCPDHLRASLGRHSLGQLIDLLEAVLEPMPRACDGAASLPAGGEPLLN